MSTEAVSAMEDSDRRTALYRHLDASGQLLYVGISLNAVARLGQHKIASDWFSRIAEVKVEWFPSREDALAAEAAAIREEKPLHNIRKQAFETAKDHDDGDADKSRRVLLRRVVHFKPMYRIRDAAEVLGLSEARVKEMCASGYLGCVVLGRHTRRNRKGEEFEFVDRRVTGWQLIDFLERLGG